jgi:hypothetical protein
LTSNQVPSRFAEVVAPTEAAAILHAVEQHVREARAVLATSDRETALSEAQQLLYGVEDLLRRFPAGTKESHDGWPAAVALRDDLGGYLLAATTLAETGVAPKVVTELLQRGAALAEGRLDRLAGTTEAKSA